MIKKLFDKSDTKVDELAEEMRVTDQRLASLEQDARQTRLALKTDVQTDKKTRERTESAAEAVQAKHGDSVSANRVQDGPTTSTNFGVKAEPPALPCGDDVLVENGTVAPKSCLSLLKMCTTTAAGGLLPTGETSTATRTTFDHSTFFVLPGRRDIFEDFNSIRLVLQQFLPACCPLLPEGH